MQRSALLSLTRTTAAHWVVPARIVLGLYLMLRLGGGLSEQLALCRANGVQAACSVLGGAEFLIGSSFVAGLLTRLAAPAVVLDFALRSLASWVTALPEVGLGWLVVPTGDWVQGALMLGTAVLALDVLDSGGGSFSVDAWLHRHLIGGDS